MKILSLELGGYKRLKLKQINYIKLTPESKIQLILGTNGSGKSSLIKELSPMPGTPNQFHKGGFKIIEISHNNSHYILKSLFHDKGNKFHFIKDGKDLLGEEGGNSSVYKDLVKQEFKITDDIHKLQLGMSKFTEMDVSKRRGWLTKFSDADYTYAFSFYKKLTEQYRECTVGVKLQQARLVQENEKLLDPQEEIQLREDIRVLNELLTGFLDMKIPLPESADDAIKNIKMIDQELDVFTRVIYSSLNKWQRAGESITSFGDIDDELIEVQASIQNYQYQIDKLCETIESQNKTLDVLKRTNVQSVSDLDISIDRLGLELNQEQSQIRFKELTFLNPVEATRSLNTVRPNLIDLFLEMEENKDRQYSRDVYIQTIDKLRELELKKKMCSEQLNQTHVKKSELEHLKEHGETTCPQCDFKWYRGYDEGVYQKHIKEIEQLTQIDQELSRTLSETSNLQERVKLYLEQYRSYTVISKSSPILEPFWNHILESSMIFDKPKNVIQAMELLSTDLQHLEKIEQIKLDMKEKLNLRVLLSRSQESNLSKLLEESEISNRELTSLTYRLQRVKARQSTLVDLRKLCLSLQTHKETVQGHLNSREQKVSLLSNLYKQQVINEFIQITRKELTLREHTLAKANVQHSVISNIKSQIDELSERAEVLKIAIKELSPAEGLIAKGLTGFINHYVAQVNSFIKKVWLYPLELIPIVPTADDDVDLDYKFQVKINDDDVDPIEDIKNCSSGMMEIIDLAFRVVGMQYLGLSEAPLFLDEFGAKLDPAHRKSANDVVTGLLTTTNFSQIFMISHYEESYGSLANTDITVLCDRNIELAEHSVFNRNTVIR